MDVMAIPCTVHHHKRDGKVVTLDEGEVDAAIAGGDAVHVEIVGNMPRKKEFLLTRKRTNTTKSVMGLGRVRKIFVVDRW